MSKTAEEILRDYDPLLFYKEPDTISKHVSHLMQEFAAQEVAKEIEAYKDKVKKAIIRYHAKAHGKENAEWYSEGLISIIDTVK